MIRAKPGRKQTLINLSSSGMLHRFKLVLRSQLCLPEGNISILAHLIVARPQHIGIKSCVKSIVCLASRLRDLHILCGHGGCGLCVSVGESGFHPMYRTGYQSISSMRMHVQGAHHILWIPPSPSPQEHQMTTFQALVSFV